MNMRQFTITLVIITACAGAGFCGEAVLPDTMPVISVNSRQIPPAWALTQRLLLTENVRAAQMYYNKYWDERGFLGCIERWGWIDGADDILQGLANFPLLYALGGDETMLDLYYTAFNGLLEQFTTETVEYAPDFGCFHDEFLTADDWHHHGEHLAAFNQLALAAPSNPWYVARAKRFAGYYLNEGLPEGAEPIYDPKLRIIRSIVNGSLGAQLEIKPEFWGRQWEDWADRTIVKGDGPLNLFATILPANAFALTGEARYRDWVLEYVSAWCERAAENNGIFPANIGLSGKIGEHWDGRWWPQSLGAWSHRGKAGSDGLGLFLPAVVAGLQNAMILSGDTKYMDALRRQVHVLMENAIEHEGKKFPPGLYEDDGWAGRFRFGRHLIALYMSEFRDDDFKLIEEEIERWGETGKFSYSTHFFYHTDDFAWLYYVLGKNPEFPERMAASDLSRIRQKVAEFSGDKSPVTERRTDHTHRYNPVATHALYNMICGGVGPLLAKGTNLLQAELWPFDPQRNRPGLPENVAMNIDSISREEVGVNIVNLSQTEPRTVVLKTGAYGENRCVEVRSGGQTTAVNANSLAVRLEAGCGAKLVLKVERLVNPPRAGLPWRE